MLRSSHKYIPPLAITEIQVGGNLLTGPIPAELGNLALEELGLGSNMFTGEIPAELGNLTLEELDLGFNLFTGEIPPGLCGTEDLIFQCSENFCGCTSCPCQQR